MLAPKPFEVFEQVISFTSLKLINYVN